MIIEFYDKDLEELVITGINRKYRKYTKQKRFMEGLARAFATLFAIESTAELVNANSFLHYEKLAGTGGKSSIRVVNGMVERIIFREYENGIRILVLELDNNHYGRKK